MRLQVTTHYVFFACCYFQPFLTLIVLFAVVIYRCLPDTHHRVFVGCLSSRHHFSRQVEFCRRSSVLPPYFIAARDMLFHIACF
jgi:hypothetical protein